MLNKSCRSVGTDISISFKLNYSGISMYTVDRYLNGQYYYMSLLKKYSI